MRYLFILFTMVFLSTAVGAQGQTSIFEAVGSGDAARVSKFMDQNIELCFEDKINFMTKAQAEKALADFYKENPPLSFKAIHKGNSKGADSNYMIGQYRSKNARNFRVYIFARAQGDSAIIQEIRFDLQR